ncbi:hypothetical protein BN1708_012218 [Verticillium longisporum]|uniref:Fungal lipase-like domain-containing protein n=1 Tax=Verticillium longisporum TaxID=100787 RepID=A0A0G4L7Q2_VERLO|nr:hypothetical protein BN1708_012218 [Verticillium longisporum]
MLFKLPVLSLLAATATAGVLPMKEYGNTLAALDERAVGVTSADLNNFRFYVQYAAAAYCNGANAPGAAVKCSENGCPQVEANRATTIASFAGATSGIEGLVVRDDVARTIVLTVRGSSNIRNWISNILFAFTGCTDLTANCKVHAGFNNAWREIRTPAIAAIKQASAANPNYTVVATGHSLGAAVATIGAAYLRAKESIPVTLYTYGSPRVGNDYFAKFVSAQAGAEYRVTHATDPVPRLPPIILGYRHTSVEYWLSGGGSHKVDYTVTDIRVCEGIASIGCNGGVLGLDIEAHLHYLQDTSACSPKGMARQSATLTDTELEARLNSYVKQDIQFVKDHMAD